MSLLATLIKLLLLLQALGQVSLAPPASYELRFQNESDNLGLVTKQVAQQQTFKCQVRLAPVAATPTARRGHQLAVSRRPLAPDELTAAAAAPAKWPANVSLSIGWLKDGLELTSGAEQVGVVNVELAKSKSATTTTTTTTTTSAMKNDKKNSSGSNNNNNKPRIEIKNTLNEGQLKLTSRLKLGHLRAGDSGQYKCLARAKFLHQDAPAAAVMAVEQALESNGGRLLVEPAIAGLPTDKALAAASHNDHNNRNGSRRPDAAAALDRPAGRSGNELEQKGSWNGKPHNDMQHANELGWAGAATSSGLANEMGRPDNDDRSRARLFEDDEDLFRWEQAERIEFISARPPAANDDDDAAGELGADRHQANDPAAVAAADEPQDEWWAEGSPSRTDSNNESSPVVDSHSNSRLLNDNQHLGADRGISVGKSQQQTIAETNYRPSGYLAGSLDSTRLGLAKLVHRMAPELGCYTGLGEHYRGNLSEAADGRRCLLWPSRPAHVGRRVAAKWRWEASDNNHNHCRNPNMDPRGPWCFVRAAELDAELASIARSNASAQRAERPLESSSTGANRSNHYVVVAHCNVSPCSQYLWLYIVAPPVGLLASLLCLVAILVRSIRRSHYNSVYVAGKRRPHLPVKIGKLLPSSGRFKRRFAPKKLVSPKPGARRHLDEEDMFEIADDLDWSEGQQQHGDPKSVAESLKLNSSFSSDSSACCKSTNQILAQDNNNSKMNSSRSVTQVGPVFATLRCHIRAGLGKQQLAMQQQRQHNKSSTFIEQCGEPLDGRKARQQQQPYGGGKQQDPNCWPNSPGASDSTISSSANSPDRQLSTQAGHLISCSTTSDDFTGAVDLSSLAATDNKCILASELAQLQTSSVALAHDRQPIYEGKFSQVQVAYVVQANEGAQHLQANAQVGTQVAVQSLKINAAIDPTVFSAANIKLHNLNHLNLLKLIGWTQLVGDEMGFRQQVTCSLVYDMAQLVDLNDWLQQQAQDMKTGPQEPGAESGIRRNLTCLAKQIALALDYLHDLNIVYKDLACRNCFLDPTKMLVKLASFNTELVLGQSDDKSQNLKSMIRPKYLLDYYVIDTRPSDSQLLPLSWIPLESILFNKFNKQTDVWSFGCLIYELFSLGGVAYFGYSSKQIIDAVRSNLMPPQPLLCPNGIYKLMCKCLSDIPAIRPNVKQVYEQLNLYSGQCSSFLDHHLCSLATAMYDDCNSSSHLIDLKLSTGVNANSKTKSDTNSITKTKSFANIKHFSPPTTAMTPNGQYDNLVPLALESPPRPELTKLSMSKSINLDGNRLMSFGRRNNNNGGQQNQATDANHYDEPVVEARKREQE